MGRLTRFPDLREFRARAARLGAATGPYQLEPAAPSGAETTSSVPWMWLGLAAAASVSLVWLGWSALPERESRTPFVERGELDRLVAELSATNARLARIETEIAGLRRSGAETGKADAELRERIDVIEEALGPATGSIGAPPAELPRSAFGAFAERAPSPAPPQSPTRLLPDVARLPAPASPPQASAGAVGAELPGSKVLPSFTHAVDLGGFGSVVELKTYWARLVTDNPLLLGGLSPRQVTQIESDGLRSYRLIAGPVEGVAASKRICEALRFRGADCRQTINAGEPI